MAERCQKMLWNVLTTNHQNDYLASVRFRELVDMTRRCESVYPELARLRCAHEDKVRKDGGESGLSLIYDITKQDEIQQDIRETLVSK